jgi:tellurite resistance-related uncharacterized protein
VKKLPDHVRPYKRTRVFTAATIPAKLTSDHQTAPGKWGVINVEKGSLKYTIGADEVHILTPDSPKGIVAPEQPHRVQPMGDVAFFVEFHQ